jgi:hypothetical protein
MTENIGKRFRVVKAGPIGNVIEVVRVEGNSTVTRTVWTRFVQVDVSLEESTGFDRRPTSTVQHFIDAGHWVEEPKPTPTVTGRIPAPSQPEPQNVTLRTEIGREIKSHFCPNFLVQVEAMNSQAFAEIESRLFLRALPMNFWEKIARDVATEIASISEIRSQDVQGTIDAFQDIILKHLQARA